LDLDNFFTDIHKYLRLLEEMVILTLKEYGIVGTRSEGETGVWLDVGTPFARKICALWGTCQSLGDHAWICIKHQYRFVYFDHIVPCGIQGKGVTSLAKELGKEMDIELGKEKLKIHFGNLFELIG